MAKEKLRIRDGLIIETDPESYEYIRSLPAVKVVKKPKTEWELLDTLTEADGDPAVEALSVGMRHVALKFEIDGQTEYYLRVF